MTNNFLYSLYLKVNKIRLYVWLTLYLTWYDEEFGDLFFKQLEIGELSQKFLKCEETYVY